MRTMPNDSRYLAPEYTPEKLVNLYEQAADNLKRKNWDACGVMSRKVLEISTKEGSTKRSLHDRIEDLADRHILTPQMKDWSHSIRLDGNDAAHEDVYSEEEVQSLFEFMDMYMRYTYTMPGMLDAKKDKVKQG